MRKDPAHPCARPLYGYSRLASVPLPPTLPVTLALRLARDFRLAAAERGGAGRGEPRLVLEQARGDLAAVRNELAADALRVAGARMLAAAAHVVGALRRGG